MAFSYPYLSLDGVKVSKIQFPKGNQSGGRKQAPVHVSFHNVP